jgi:hypothetical protein
MDNRVGIAMCATDSHSHNDQPAPHSHKAVELGRRLVTAHSRQSVGGDN